MSFSDTLFRAFAEYRERTLSNRECEKRFAEIARTGTAADTLEAVRTECEIEDDWIEAIETGLVSVGKAIAQERQFIRSNGEVTEIEKVKSVSRESVEHLARHSNLLTKEPQGGDLIPDRLFTVERLTDYAVYENRFLYMLLCYLRDFLSWRYQKIADLTQTYEGKLSLEKKLERGDRKTVFRVYAEEERKGDEFLTQANKCRAQLERIDGLLHTVERYLAVPLMQFVAKSPKLTPPVTETNVLKTNKDFKGAMQLYYFISAYAKDGFTVRQERVRLNPFDEGLAEEFAQAAELICFLAYKAGTGQQESLLGRYRQELEKERREAILREQAELEKLKQRVAQTGEGIDRYLMLLEKRAQELEAKCSELPLLKTRLEGAERELQEATAARRESERLLAEREEEFRLQTESLRASYEERLRTQAERAEAEKKELVTAHAQELQAKQEECAREISSAREACERTVSELRLQSEEERKKAAQEKEALERELGSCRAECTRLQRENTLAQAKMISLKKECGALTQEDDFTGRAQFDELEHQYRVFRAFFREEWKKAKKRIRREVFQAERDAGKDGEDRKKDKDGK